jgi:transcriptional regulator with XRE-family HTH domain
MNSRRDERALEAFGKAVRARRTALDLSQEKLAELAELHRTYVADIERGSRNVSLLNILRLAAALEAAPGDLMHDAFPS